MAFAWRKVAWTSVLLASVAAACVWGPVLAHQQRLREEDRLAQLAAAERLDRSGLWFCRAPLRDREGRFPETKDADVVVWAMPTWRSPWRVSLAGASLEVAESRGRSMYPTIEPPPPPEGWTPRAHTEPATPQGAAAQAAYQPAPLPPVRLLSARAQLDPARARRIRERFARTVAYATDEPMYGADGAMYQIHMGGRCYETWTPSPWTGAGRLVAIAELLALHGSRGPDRDAGRSLDEIDELLASFEHGDGSEPLARAGEDPEQYTQLVREPEWPGEPASPRVH